MVICPLYQQEVAFVNIHREMRAHTHYVILTVLAARIAAAHLGTQGLGSLFGAGT